MPIKIQLRTYVKPIAQICQQTTSLSRRLDISQNIASQPAQHGRKDKSKAVISVLQSILICCLHWPDCLQASAPSRFTYTSRITNAEDDSIKIILGRIPYYSYPQHKTNILAVSLSSMVCRTVAEKVHERASSNL